jgi:hypothetical protein
VLLVSDVLIKKLKKKLAVNGEICNYSSAQCEWSRRNKI